MAGVEINPPPPATASIKPANIATKNKITTTLVATCITSVIYITLKS